MNCPHTLTRMGTIIKAMIRASVDKNVKQLVFSYIANIFYKIVHILCYFFFPFIYLFIFCFVVVVEFGTLLRGC
jgi:hypothetical protein